MSEPYARIRVRREQAELLDDLLFRERGNMIAEKIAVREAGRDPALLRIRLMIVKYLMEEVRRAMDDIAAQEADE
jgi:hypothetical protein